MDHVLQVIILILALRALHMVTATTKSCAEVRRHFVSNEIGPDKAVPRYPSIAEDLRVCPNGVSSCCNRDMEDHYQEATTDIIHTALITRISSLRFNFASFAKNFQKDVVKTLEIAGNSTRDALRKTLRKRKIVSDRKDFALVEMEQLFYSLGLNSNRKDIRKTFDKFADRLFLIIADERYNITQRDIPHEECVMRQRKELDLFVDVPTISAGNISTAIEYARALHEALPAGALAVNITGNARLTKHCEHALVKMQFCSHCWGLTLIKPCMGLCKNVMRGCLAGISELDLYWNYYVTALAEVSSRMRSSQPMYNLEIALKDFENKLLSGVSTLIGNVTAMKEVEARCENSRTLDRSKRSDASSLAEANEDIEEENKLPSRLTQRRNGRRRNRNKPRHRNNYDVTAGFDKAFQGLQEAEPIQPSSEPQPIRPPHEVLQSPVKRSFSKKPPYTITKKTPNQLHKRMRGFISSLNDTINYFRYLPDDICDSKSGFGVQVADDTTCWDGNVVARPYKGKVIPIGYGKQAENPEVRVLKVENHVIHSIEKLRRTTLKLMQVYGNAVIPDILLRSPVYEERKDSDSIDNKASKFPCDDEDECGDLGSGEEKEGKKDSGSEQTITDEQVTLLAEKMTEIDIIPSEKENKTSVADDSEAASHEGVKCKRKGHKKCHHGKAKKPPKIGQRTVEVTTTKPGNAASPSSSTHVTYIALLIACKVMLSWAVPV